MALKLYFRTEDIQLLAEVSPFPLRCEWLSNCIFVPKTFSLRSLFFFLRVVVNGSQIVFSYRRHSAVGGLIS